MLLGNVHIVNDGPADIRIHDSVIKNISLPGKMEADELSFEFENSIVFPGLINSHEHLEFNLFPRFGGGPYKDYVEWGDQIHKRHKESIDRIQRIPYDLRYQYGLFKNLVCGVTTVINHGNAPHLYFENLSEVYTNYNYIHSTRLDKKWRLKLNLLFNGLPFVVHTGEGTNDKSANEAKTLLRWNIFRKEIIGIHAISVTEKLNSKFRAIVWCPDSNLFLYNKTADISKMKLHTEILFGTDSNLSADWNIWNHLRLARKLGMLDDSELYESVTEKAAKVWKIYDRGVIEINKKADLVIAEKNNENNMGSFYSCNPENIIMIIKNGKIVLVDDKFAADHRGIQYEHFDKVLINNRIKLLPKGFNDLMKKISEFLPPKEFPVFSKEREMNFKL